MELIREAGVFGPLAVLVFVTGLGATLRTRAASTAVPFVLALLATGEIGQGLGQHAVRKAIEGVPDVAEKVALLNAGTGEAASCLVISGAAALLLGAIAGALALTTSPRR